MVRSLAVLAVLFLAYNAWLLHSRPDILYLQNQWQANAVAAEEFIHSQTPKNVALVGSSMTAHMQKEMLGNEFWNLGFSSGSSATGLEILSRAKVLPRIVLVEANMVSTVDSGFVKTLFQPLTYFLKDRLPATRTCYQPINLLVNRVKSVKNAPQEALGQDAFAKILAINTAAYNQAPDTAVLETDIKRMAKSVAILSSRGVHVVFFRMPMHPDLRNSALCRESYSRLKAAFPDSRFQWLDHLPGELPTFDGVHLLDPSAREFANLLRKETVAMAAK